MPSREACIAAWGARWCERLPRDPDDLLAQLEDHLRCCADDPAWLLALLALRKVPASAAFAPAKCLAPSRST